MLLLQVVIPGDGAVPFVNIEDLGEANARLLLASGEYENQTVHLTGTRAVTIKEIVALLEPIVGHEIKIRNVSEAEWLERHANKGPIANYWVSTYAAIAKGKH